MTNQSLETLIELILYQAQKLDIVHNRDIIYFRNCLYQKLGIHHKNHILKQIRITWRRQTTPPTCSRQGVWQQTCGLNMAEYSIVERIKSLIDTITIPQICGCIIDKLTDQQKQSLGDNYDMIETNLINTLLPSPYTIEQKFWHKYRTGKSEAIDWYYSYNCHTNYIKAHDLARNQSWVTITASGELQITINLAKPEKDPLEIAKIKSLPKENNKYPQCLLCIENEGYSGSMSQPARHTHRMIEIELNGSAWFFQFSPYAYYNEHSIIINAKHSDMVINDNTFDVFFDFLDFAPNYIIGSNSDIPIVGGSILNHDHYQAGNYQFPIELSPIKFSISSPEFPHVQINYLNWPISTIQLIGNRNDIVHLSRNIIDKWYNYFNPELNIIAHTMDVRHNGITPVMRKLDNNCYSLYILLRNNRTDNEHPEGIFHPNRRLHHIKKENIGLIEAMGLAILPGRLDIELKTLAQLLLINHPDLALERLSTDESLVKHKDWFIELTKRYNKFNDNSINDILKTEIGYKFEEVLKDCGVFKDNPIHDMAIHELLQNL